MEKEQITFKETIVSCSDGSQILEGLWYNKEVAIKSMQRKNEEKAKIEIEAYRLLKEVPHVLCCFSHQKNGDEHHLILQRAVCTLHELIQAVKNNFTSHQYTKRKNNLILARANFVLWNQVQREPYTTVALPKTVPSAYLCAIIK
jgi:hypothetical protein